MIYSMSGILAPEELKLLSDLIKISESVLTVFRRGQKVYKVSGILDRIEVLEAMDKTQSYDFFNYVVSYYDADVSIPIVNGEFQFFFKSPDKLVTETMTELITELENMLYD